MIYWYNWKISLNIVNLLQFIFFTGGIVFLTLIVNGSTTQFILHFLDMDKLSATKVCLITSFNILSTCLPHGVLVALYLKDSNLYCMILVDGGELIAY